MYVAMILLRCYCAIPKPPHQVSIHATKSEESTQSAQGQSPCEQHDHANIPYWPVGVPEAKIQTVKSVLKPALYPPHPVNPIHQLTFEQVSINPRTTRVVETHLQCRQWWRCIVSIGP